MIIIDVEIEKAIPPRNHLEPCLPDIEYCEGWRDFKGMGITCVCTYDLRTNLSRAFLRENMQELPAYLAGEATAGFNTRRFDMPLLAEHGVTVDGERHYDILESIWIALGLDPDNFVPRTHGGWSLDVVCYHTLGHRKSGDGASAPIWWQRGLRGRVVDYCLRDVWLEARLLQHIIDEQCVLRADERVDLRVPDHLLPAKAAA